MFTTQEHGFDLIDYVIFFILCTASCAGGLWYSAVGSRKRAVIDITDYLLGGKKMKTIPVSMSLIASYVSGVTILGTPAETFNYGTEYWLIIFGIMMSCITVATVYLPVFFMLGVSSSYQYLELRFNRHVRAVASILFLLDEVLFLPMVVFVPALAFNQLTGVNKFVVGGVMVAICGLYTVLGGLKAVVWTDSVQTTIMFIGVIVVAIAATVAVGGPAAIMRVADKSDRLKLDNWSFSPYVRQTGWGAIFGGFIFWTCFNSVNQTMVQRYLALPSKKKAAGALSIFCSGATLAICLCVWLGLAAWTAWVQGGCHPDGRPLVNDRMLPAFVTYVTHLEKMPGVPGIFMAGLFGAGLSSLSAVLNACALVAIEDILRGWLQVDLKPFVEGILARFATASLAILSVIMLIVIDKLGGVLGVATALSAIAASATCGVFTLGMTCWWVGPRGATAGAIAGATMAGTISFGSQVAVASGLKFPPEDFLKACPNLNSSHMTYDTDYSSVFPLFRLSFHWIAPLGLFTTIFVGAIVGRIFDKKEGWKMDAELYTPFVWRCLPKAAHEHRGETAEALLIRNIERHSRRQSLEDPSPAPPK